MWSGSKIMCRFTIPRMVYAPRSVSPRLLQCGVAPYAGSATGGVTPYCCWIAPNSASRWVNGLGSGAASWSLSCTSEGYAAGQCRMSQKEPVSRKFALFTATPVCPSSPATPDSALSNLLTSSICETPILRTWVSCRSMEAFVQDGSGASAFIVHPNSTLVSMPMTTASLPWLITRRAW